MIFINWTPIQLVSFNKASRIKGSSGVLKRYKTLIKHNIRQLRRLFIRQLRRLREDH